MRLRWFILSNAQTKYICVKSKFFVMDYSNSLYYTFSTIAQVLAGFLALSGVFVIYQIQRFSYRQSVIFKRFVPKLEKNYAEEFLVNLDIDSELENYRVIINKLDKFAEILQNRNWENDLRLTRATQDNIQAIENKKENLIILTRVALIVGILTIFYSVAILSLVPDIICNYAKNESIIITVGIVGLVSSFILMSIGIFKSLPISKKE